MFEISVLIPTQPKRAAMFAEAIASVHAQTLDHSHYEIVSRCSSAWYPEKFNDLARTARGKRVLLLCDDDKLRPAALQLMLATALATDAHVVSGNVQTFSAAGAGASARFNGAPWTLDSFKHGPPIWISSLVDRTRMLEAGGFNFGALQYADWALWYELWKRGAKNAHVDETLWDYRGHDEQFISTGDPGAARAAFYAAYPELFPS